MDLFLQLWGGLFYLSNKVLFSLAQSRREATRRYLLLWAWWIYILGVPAWVIILLGHQNWIAASIEAGGVPAMLLGLYNTYYQPQRPNRLFTRVVSLCTYGSLVFGLSYSIAHHGGLNSLSQLLEIGVMLGFLLGSYLMAKAHISAWLFFMLMNISMALLMFIQDKPVLMAQQLVSFGFVAYGFYHAYRSRA